MLVWSGGEGWIQERPEDERQRNEDDPGGGKTQEISSSPVECHPAIREGLKVVYLCTLCNFGMHNLYLRY